jgi:hypothetical protein
VISKFRRLSLPLGKDIDVVFARFNSLISAKKSMPTNHYSKFFASMHVQESTQKHPTVTVHYHD